MIDSSAIADAQDRIADLVRETPVQHSRLLSEHSGADVRCKLELFQRTGSFKLRGAANCIRSLDPDERSAGVITASAGNHAQGVALAAAASGVEATVVMPEGASIAKVAATRSYGAEVVLAGEDYTEAQQRANELAERDGLTYVHAFDDPAVIAGQGTLGLEILAAVPETDVVIVPIGGGGLISGVATAVKGVDPSIRVVGVQAAGAASVPQSLERGEIFERDAVDTIADGIATRRIGEMAFEIIRERVDDVVTVTDDDIAIGVTRMLERSKVLVEPAGAASVAAILANEIDVIEGDTVVALLSGGNVDLNVLSTLLLRGLIQSGRYVKMQTVVKDRPGALEHLSGIIGDHRANIFAIRHDRTSRDVAMNAAEVELELETRGLEHLDEIMTALSDRGYDVEVLS